MSTIFYVSYGAMWLLLVVIGVLLLLVYRHFGVMALGTLEGVQRDGLPVGEGAPSLSGVTAEGKDIHWTPPHGRSALLVFAAPDCEPCAKILPYVGRIASSPNGSHIPTLVIVAGPRENAMRLTEKFRLPLPCLAEDESGAFDRYRVRVTPFAFVIGEDGRILAKGLCSDALRLRGLLEAGGLGQAAALVETSFDKPLPRAGAEMSVHAQEV